MGSIGSANAALHLSADIIIIGGGFSGLYALYKARELGLTVKLIEAGSDYGGTWHWNRYPGARVDTETPYYSLSIPKLWKTWTWTERFPGHEELRAYFRHCGTTLNAYEDTYFNTVVDGVSFRDGKWHLNIRDEGTAVCKYLVLSTGSSYKRHYPNFKDMEKYKGQLVHSAAFPEGGLDVKGKRVAVIGNGATGVQIVQELAKEDCDLTAYIRTPNIALPMKQRKMSAEEQEAAKSFYGAAFQSAKNCRSGFPYNTTTKLLSEVSEEEWKAQFEELWERGGFSFLLSNYRDFLVSRDVNKVFYKFWAEKVRERMKNPEKRDIVAPLDQSILFGTKRSSLEQDYYESLDRDNVTVLNLKQSGLSHFTEKGIVTADGRGREYDIVVLATGYDSLTGSLTDLNIEDTSGRLLQEKWKQATYTYLGLMIDGLPNAFLTYSPQAPTSLANGPPIIEIQVDWIVDAIKKMRDEGIDTIVPRFEAAEKWREDIQEMNSKTLFPYTDSWYMGANIPGKPREQLIYLAGVDVYAKEVREALDGWKGFDVRMTTQKEAKDAQSGVESLHLTEK
ncbi:uncharacterized protein HMPREF1541_08228 [Cyphellophora europaea CBS 101466]|uniref:FAD/NAD(P)-binding domain-containing protein n=1 Tax=Cyphellophora europaea (strain CBS 101466) TaxID=1220924 RepID=W2RNF9_CYPE1|nr:uncharacterized protein HMPREF1541_08228 [Cyphellophora europaea CBS 101466]ETN37238.1 hypothetical protein HMPREF1541_08228 [Cyphellophora europaea CBS 101466]